MPRNVAFEMKIGQTGNVVLVKLLLVLDSFDSQECQAKNDRQNEIDDNRLLLSHLRAANGHRNGQAGTDQNRRVDGSEPEIDAGAGSREISEVPVAIHEIGAEHAAEEHDFGDQDQPHAKARGVFLLLSSGEVMQEG